MYKSKPAAATASSSVEDVVLGGGTAVKPCVWQLEAVRQKRVYAAPANIFGWDRTGARTSLQILQAAKIFIRIFSKILILELSRKNFTASLSPTS
ncbi:hypothetical protein [uncultured Campylobacter sp.]|uniref:hypothetical protein n=1 Tax=uncultured Campylobacter sp. TaxID=218934 RepID=UPI0025DA9516|nr:hypothetical protein [uncultured Campylobacter sp.]